jgi:hypothetical protein
MTFIAKVKPDSMLHQQWDEFGKDEYELFENVFHKIETDYVCTKIIDLISLLENEDIQVAAFGKSYV